MGNRNPDKIPQIILQQSINPYWFEDRIIGLNDRLTKFPPVIEIQIIDFWDDIQALKKEVIIEFQKLAGMPYFDFVQNYVNGSMDNFNDFQTFIKRIGMINQLKERLNKAVEVNRQWKM